MQPRSLFAGWQRRIRTVYAACERLPGARCSVLYLHDRAHMLLSVCVVNVWIVMCAHMCDVWSICYGFYFVVRRAYRVLRVLMYGSPAIATQCVCRVHVGDRVSAYYTYKG